MMRVAHVPAARVAQGVLCALALLWALAASLALAPQAHAYYSLDQVNIDLSSTELALEKGSVATVGCGIDPASEQQLPGCGMAECPQGCGDLTTPDGVVGGCQNDEGWCTCAGLNYVTYNTKVTITSSAPNVARASYTSGAITVKAYGAGTATITVKATLSKHADAVAQLVVAVNEPVKQEEPAQAADSGSGASGSESSASGSTGGSSASSSTASGSGSSKVTSSTSGSASTKSSGSKSKSTSSSKGTSTSTTSTSASSGVRVTAASSTSTPSATGGVTIVGSSAEAAGDASEGDQAETDGRSEGAEGQKGAEDAEESKANPENFEVENASDAVGAVSSVTTAQASGAKGNASTDTVPAVMGVACIAVAAGAMRYRRWQHQREPIDGSDEFDD